MCNTPTTFPAPQQSQLRLVRVSHEGGSRSDPLRIGIERRSYLAGKRSIDLLVASAALIVLLPLFPLLMLLVKCSSRGPVIYKHLRIGRSGRRFFLYKLRTMRCDSEEQLALHLQADTNAKREWELHQKLRFDPRITRVGAFLRRFSLDELPQLFNVLAGDMSLVGPRPITEDEIWRYGEAFEAYASVKPGITGVWQVSGRGCLSYDRRVALDSEYVLRRTLPHDLKILLRTPWALREWPKAPSRGPTGSSLQPEESV